MTSKLLGLMVAITLTAAAVPAQAQTSIGVWVRTGPVTGYSYGSYGGMYYYPSYVPGAVQVIYNPRYRGYGWWDGRHQWHTWSGPRRWDARYAHPWHGDHHYDDHGGYHDHDHGGYHDHDHDHDH